MKVNVVLLSAVLLLSGAGFAQDKSIKDDISSAISDAYSMGKEAISGVVDGLERGMKGNDSLASFETIADSQELAQSVLIKRYSLDSMPDGTMKLTLAVENKTDKDLRITGLGGIKSLIMIDSEGFASPLNVRKESRNDIFVFGRSATKAVFIFNPIEGTPKTLRILGVDVAL